MKDTLALMVVLVIFSLTVLLVDFFFPSEQDISLHILRLMIIGGFVLIGLVLITLRHPSRREEKSDYGLLRRLLASSRRRSRKKPSL